MQQIRTKDGIMVSILDLTADNFDCPKGEEARYHCRIEQVKFDSNTGKRLSTPRIQIFGKKEFENGMLHNLRQQGYTVEVLHNPTEWLKANAERVAAEKAARTQAAKEAAEKRQREADEAKEAAMTEKIMAKLRAEGWAPADDKKQSSSKKK